MKWPLIILLISGLGLCEESFKFFYYHDKPPYVLKSSQGIYQELAKQINSVQSKLKVKVSFLPRKRINLYLEQKTLDGAVIGVNPVWFKDADKKKYFWTHAFLKDRDVVVSLKSSPVEYDGPNSVIGKAFVGNRGYYYFGITELVQSSKIKQFNVNNDSHLLQVVASKRASFAIVGERTFKYFQQTNPDKNNSFYIAEKPHDEFERMIMVPFKHKKEFEVINSAIQKIIKDPEWIKVLNRY